jgi:Trypsin-co-occurring domain 1
MNGARDADAAVQVVTARLPSGAPVQVEVTVPAGGDELTSVGLRDLDLDHALDTIAEIGTVVVDRLKAAKPTKATVELKLGFAVEAGKLTALWVGGKGEASLTVTLEWSGHQATDEGSNG